MNRKPKVPDAGGGDARAAERKINDLRQRKYEAGPGNGAAEKRQHAKRKLSARERIGRLTDWGSFIEYDIFATHRSTNFDLADRKILGDGVVTGSAAIDGRPVMLFSHEASAFGGSLGEVFAEKVVKVMDIAYTNGLPIIGINDSGGARIQEGVVALAGYTDIFFRNVECSGVVPQLSLILGPCTGGAVYSPAITDFIFMVEHTGYMFITGPEVIRVTTGENVTFDQLGGAEVHNFRSGVAHFLAKDEAQCFAQVRQLLSLLPSSSRESPPCTAGQPADAQAADRLQHLIPESSNLAYDIKDVIAGVVDQQTFMEVQAHYARNLVVGFARIEGQVVGVVGNQPKVLAGALDIDASDKGGRFVRFCDAFNIPLVTFVDVPGFLPGTAQEYGGIIRHGAKLLYAYAEATVPKLTVITRKAYGGAYCVMCSKHLRADLNLAWPTAEIAVMGPGAAVNIIFKRQIETSEDPEDRRRQLVVDYTERFCNPYVAAERGYVDDVIEPKQTRERLVSALRLTVGKIDHRKPRRHGNIPL